jgi:hypothetical protein
MASSGKLINSTDILDGTIVNADVNAAAAIVYSKLSLASSIVSGDIVDGTLVNADVNAAAAIAASKLAAGGTANRVVATADGTTMAMQQIVTAMLASNAVTNAQMVFATSDVTLTGTAGMVDLNAAQTSTNYASSGGTLIAYVQATIENSAAGDWVQIGVMINGVQWNGTSYRASAAGYYTCIAAMGLETPAAGTIVIKPRWALGVTTNTAKCYGSGLKMLILELKK